MNVELEKENKKLREILAKFIQAKEKRIEAINKSERQLKNLKEQHSNLLEQLRLNNQLYFETEKEDRVNRIDDPGERFVEYDVSGIQQQSSENENIIYDYSKITNITRINDKSGYMSPQEKAELQHGYMKKFLKKQKLKTKDPQQNRNSRTREELYHNTAISDIKNKIKNGVSKRSFN